MQATTPLYLGIGIDDDHDISVDDAGNLVMASGTEAIAQLVKERLMTYRGEWFLDVNVGVPWVQQVMVRPFNEMVAEAVTKDAILATLGVVEMLSFEMDVRRASREMALIRCDVMTIYDEVIEVGL